MQASLLKSLGYVGYETERLWQSLFSVLSVYSGSGRHKIISLTSIVLLREELFL